MGTLRNLLRNGFDIVEMIQRLVAEVDQLQDDIREIRQLLAEQRGKGKKEAPKAES